MSSSGLLDPVHPGASWADLATFQNQRRRVRARDLLELFPPDPEIVELLVELVELATDNDDAEGILVYMLELERLGVVYFDSSSGDWETP